MEDLSTKPFAFQQKVADCKTLYLACGGRHHDYIQAEMRSLGHETFNKRCLYADRDKQGNRTPGWPERFGWKQIENGELKIENAKNAAPPCVAASSEIADDPRNSQFSMWKQIENGELRIENERNAAPPCVAASSEIADDPRDSQFSILNSQFEAWLRRVSPGMTWDWKYQQYVYKKLKRVTDGICKRLMIFMPPRHGKSELVTQRYAAWRLKRDPKMRVVVASYNQKLANRFSRGIRRLFATEDTENTEGKANKLKLHSLHDASTCSECIARANKCPSERATENTESSETNSTNYSASSVPSVANFRHKNSESEWETKEGGGVRAVGVGAGITGFGADLVIIDDPVKGHAQAESAASRENIWEWFNSDIYTRLEPNGAIILIQTRWHEDDLAGRLLREMHDDPDAEQWEVINLPALAEEVQSASFSLYSSQAMDAEGLVKTTSSRRRKYSLKAAL